jgi:hypothetical protein
MDKSFVQTAMGILVYEDCYGDCSSVYDHSLIDKGDTYEYTWHKFGIGIDMENTTGVGDVRYVLNLIEYKFVLDKETGQYYIQRYNDAKQPVTGSDDKGSSILVLKSYTLTDAEFRDMQEILTYL